VTAPLSRRGNSREFPPRQKGGPRRPKIAGGVARAPKLEGSSPVMWDAVGANPQAANRFHHHASRKRRLDPPAPRQRPRRPALRQLQAIKDPAGRDKGAAPGNAANHRRDGAGADAFAELVSPSNVVSVERFHHPFAIAAI